jgi:amino acid adenylation domain-containing protein
MSKLVQQIAALPPAKRAALIQRLQQDGHVHNIFQLSFAQQRLRFLYGLDPSSPAYNLAEALLLKGPLDATALQRSLTTIVARHEALRTIFPVIEGEAVQVIVPELTVALPEIDLWSRPVQERESEARRLIQELAQQPFVLEEGPLLRAALLRLADDEQILLLAMHHIIADGWSMGVLFRELAALYAAYTARQPGGGPLPALPIQYADYSLWQRQRLQGETLRELLDYWAGHLGDPVPVLELPTDRPRPPLQQFHGAHYRFTLPPSLRDSLQQLSQRLGLTLFMTLLGGFQALLARYSGQEDVVIGTPIANRNRAEIEGLIGCFVNTLVLRANLGGDPSVEQLLERARELCVNAYAHQDLPFEKLVEALQPERDLSRNPLFQVMFVLQNASEATLKLPGLRVEHLRPDLGTAQLDLRLSISETAQSLACLLEYNSDLFDAATIQRLAGHFQTLLEGMAREPRQRLSRLPLLTAVEQRQLLQEWTATGAHFPLDQSVAQLFEAQVRRSPDAIAAQDGEQALSYAELNRRANRLARQLMAQGVGPESLVALLDQRSVALLTAILAVFKAGGAYLPLDPQHPPARLRQVLAQSGSRLVLAGDDFLDVLAEAITELEAQPRIMRITPAATGQESDNLPAVGDPQNLAYVIYTSGSTGLPKGAMVERRGMINHLYLKIRDLDLNERDTLAQTASQCFDISVWQFLAPLLVGGRVLIVPDEIAHDPGRLLPELIARQVSIWEAVPSLLSALLEGLEQNLIPRHELAALRWLMLTGEALPPDLCERWLARYPQIPIMNAYGPTECSDDVTHHVIGRPPATTLRPTPIGRAVANMQLYILDAAYQPQPIGVAGEIYVGGVGVGRGYLGDAAKTAQVFVPHPFTTQPGARLYKTGDLARYLPDGTLEYLGRLDHQVKLRGYRIELGEIEAILRQHPAVREAVVVAREDAGSDKRLVAYVVGEHRDAETSEQSGSRAAELRRFLQQRLPEYMLPSAFVELERLPLTPNGKLDRAALPAPTAVEAPDAVFVAPGTQVEQAIAATWQEVLRVEKIGVHDNFFDLGGHSLLIIQLQSKLRAALERDLSLVELLKYPTVSALARYLSEEPAPAAAAKERQDRVEARREALKRRQRQPTARGEG